MKPNLSFAKIVATPTASSWSQVYNAGSLFVVLSLKSLQTDEEISLTSLGKEIINNLEAEFFTLETKDLANIKQAVTNCIQEIPENVFLSFSLAYVKEQIVYLVIYGAGVITMKRDTKINKLLQRTETNREFLTASGYIKQADILLVQTKQFADLISDENLKTAFDLALPNDIAETLTPHIHNADDGGAAAIIIAITSIPAQSPTLSPDMPTDAIADTETTAQESPRTSFIARLKLPRGYSPKLFIKRILPKNISTDKKGITKKISLTIIAVIILVLLSYQIISTIQVKRHAQLQKEFASISAEAKNKIDEASGIKTLNPGDAQKEFQAVNQMITDKLPHFPEGSDERNKLIALQKQVQAEISQPVESNLVKATPIDNGKSILLKALIDHPEATSVSEDDANIYILTGKSIIQKSKSSDKESTAIKNDNDWQDAISINAYNGNLYVLDTTNGVLKFVAGKNGYGKQSYFQANPADIAHAVSMAVDGSVWIVTKVGKILKYTKGTPDQFALRGSPVTLQNPKQIVTNVDISNVYILDSANSRVVQIAKDGTYKMQYHASVFKDAKAIDVREADKKIYVLSLNKIFEIPLQ